MMVRQVSRWKCESCGRLYISRGDATRCERDCKQLTQEKFNTTNYYLARRERWKTDKKYYENMKTQKTNHP